jgi:hypothetical protein
MSAEPGAFHVTDGEARAILGASYTGRSISIDAGYRAAAEWQLSVLRSEKDANGRSSFAASLDVVAVAHEPTRFFRGRLFHTPPDLHEPFGPPEPDEARLGRYNEARQPALYLSTSVDGVTRELADRRKKELWVREFDIPLRELRVVDLTRLSVDSFEAAVLFLSERDRGLDKTGAEFRFSRLVAKIVADRFDGMLVPGVRGDSEVIYSNLVLFRPGDAWREWQASPPRQA